MMPVPENTLEVGVKQQLFRTLKTNNVLSSPQSEIKQKRSCESVINTILDHWRTEVENKKIVAAVFLSFKRVLDTVNRNIFMKKYIKLVFKMQHYHWLS